MTVAFRMLMAANKHTTPPPPSFSAITPQVGAVMGVIGTNAYDSLAEPVILPSSTTYFFTAYLIQTSGNGTYASMATIHEGYTISGTPVLVDSSDGIRLVGANVSATGYLLAYATGGVFYGAYLTSSSATLTLVTSPTTIFGSSAGTTEAGACVLNSLNGLVINCGTSAQNIALISPTLLSVISSQSLTLTMAFPGVYNNLLLTLSSTLAVLVYYDGTDIQCAGIDVTLGVSFVVNTSHVLSATSSNASYTVCALTSSTFLVSYAKSSLSIGARVITVSSGGSVTVGTEYTFATGANTSNAVSGSVALTSTLVMLSIFESANIGSSYQFSVPLTISGTVITFGSAQYSIVSGMAYDVIGVALAPVSATQAAQLYLGGSSNYTGTSYTGFASILDYGSANPTWGATYNGTFVHGGTLPNVSLSYTSNVCYLGANRALVNYTNAGTQATTLWDSVLLDTNASNITAATTSASATQSNSQLYTSAMCRVYNDDGSNTRSLAAFYDGSLNTQFGVLFTASPGATTINSLATSFSGYVDPNGNLNSLLISMTPDTSLYLQGFTGAGSTHTLQASIITTSTTSVSNISSITTLVTTNGTSVTCYPKAGKALSSTVAVIVYQSDYATGFHSGFFVGIVNISSGTPVLVTSAQLTPMVGNISQCSAGFNVGANTGVCLYSSSGSNTVGIGFSFTTTTVTVSGSTTTLESGSPPTSFTNGCIGVSSTEFIALLNTTFYLITLAGINTITINGGTASGLAANYVAFDITENQNAVVYSGVTSGGSVSTTGYIFRGS